MGLPNKLAQGAVNTVPNGATTPQTYLDNLMSLPSVPFHLAQGAVNTVSNVASNPKASLENMLNQPGKALQGVGEVVGQGITAVQPGTSGFKSVVLEVIMKALRYIIVELIGNLIVRMPAPFKEMALSAIGKVQDMLQTVPFVGPIIDEKNAGARSLLNNNYESDSGVGSAEE